MISVHWAKLGLAMLGLLVFFIGAKLGLGWLRWAGIVLVAAAWLLRFYKSKTSTQAASSPEDQ